MPGVMDSLATINSTVRTLLAVVVVGAGGSAAWLGYRAWQTGADDLQAVQAELADKQAALDAARAEVAAKDQAIVAQKQQIDQLETAMRLLKVDHRLAELKVLEQPRDPETGELTSVIQFVEVNDEGYPIDEPRVFRLKGDLVYVDYWVVKFEDKYVEQSDLDRSTSICLFRRIFGEQQEPQQGYRLDEVGSRPTAYARGGKMSEFERKIWDDFWNIANNPERAKELGIRAAHGEAVSTKLRPGKTYRLLLRASGGLTITPEGETPAS